MSNNPLKQYFRRPSIYIRLPSKGAYYDTSVVEIPENQELPVYPMTAIDEVTSKTPDAVFNGQAVVDIIKSCVPAIKNPWKINSIDLDTVLIAIRVASTGDEMDVLSTCPSCNNEGKYGINLVQLLSEKQDINYENTLKIRDLEIKFKPLTYSETNKNNMTQYEIQKSLVILNEYEDNEDKRKQTQDTIKKLNSIMSEAIGNTIEYIKTPETSVTDPTFIREFLDNCDRQTNNAIREFSIELKNKNQLKPLRLKCINCQHEYEQNLVLNITDFFV